MRKPVAAVLAVAVAVPAVALAAGPKITGSGAGQVKVGASYTKLRQKGLVGKLNGGCELAGPNAAGAKLKAPLKGSVDFGVASPRKVQAITITGGAANARGVKVGDAAAEIQSAYDNVNVNHGTDDVFGITLYKVPKASGGKIVFGVNVDTEKVDLIGIPHIPFCE